MSGPWKASQREEYNIDHFSKITHCDELDSSEDEAATRLRDASEEDLLDN
jgi:hypothetical protein